MHVINSSRDRHLVERFNLFSKAAEALVGFLHQWLVAPIMKKNRDLKHRRELGQLDDHMLRDIGLQKFDLENHSENPSSVFKYPSW